MQRGVNVIIQNDKGEILLTKREDFEVWCLPGGGIEKGELAVEAAKREVREETGLEIEITGLTGIYYRKEWLGGRSEGLVFRANVVGGELAIDLREVLEADWFGLNNIPEDLLVTNKAKIRDFEKGLSVNVSEEKCEWPLKNVNTRKELYKMRDESGLTRKEFYLKYFDFE